MPLLDFDPSWYFVDLHNRRTRSYWHCKEQSISCRVRSTRSGNAANFRKNIIQYIYNKNIREFRVLFLALVRADQKIIEDTFGITNINHKIREKTEKIIFARTKLVAKSSTWLINIRHWENEIKELRKEQYNISQQISDSGISDIINILRLHNVVSTKLLGYYKELFFLKCYYNGRHPQITLRALYHLNTDYDLMPSEYNENNYREEIVLIVENYLRETLM